MTITYLKDSQSQPNQSRFRLKMLLALAFFLCLIPSSPSLATQFISLSLGALDEGDDRYRPEWIARWKAANSISSELHYFGRSQGPSIQTSWLLAIAHNYALFGGKLFQARIGAALAYEQTTIRSPDQGKRQHANINYGPFLGLGLQTGKKFLVTADWNSAILPAGYGVLFLATARKQSVSLGLAWVI